MPSFLKKPLLFYFTFAFSMASYAGTGTGKITGIIPYASGGDEILLIKIENTSSDTPSCNTTIRFAMKNTGNLNFKSTQVAALAAMMAGSNVIIRGGNTCDAWGNAETLLYLCVGNISC